MIGDPQSIAYTAEQVSGLIYALGHASPEEDRTAVVVLEREPDNDHGWIEVFPTRPGLPRYAIWKKTGAVHTVDEHGAVSDDPVWPDA